MLGKATKMVRVYSLNVGQTAITVIALKLLKIDSAAVPQCRSVAIPQCQSAAVPECGGASAALWEYPCLSKKEKKSYIYLMVRKRARIFISNEAK